MFDLKVKNEAGKSPYNILLAKDEGKFYSIWALTEPAEIGEYLDDLVAFYGEDVFKKIGGRLLNKALYRKPVNLALVQYLMDEKGLKLYRVLSGGGNIGIRHLVM